MPFAGYKDFKDCVEKQVAKGKSKESAQKICGALQAKVEKKESIIENVNLSWSPEFKITESEDGKSIWLDITGVALEETISRNGNNYTIENLKENDGAKFSWIVGHPEDASHPDHIVGGGELSLESNKLIHAGKIRNTKKYPDIVEKVKDGLIVPSIHAIAGKVKRVEDDGGVKFNIENLRIPGIGLINKHFQGLSLIHI